MAVEKLRASFNHASYPLKFIIVHPAATTIMVIETDYIVYASDTLDHSGEW